MPHKKNGGFIAHGQPYVMENSPNCEFTDVEAWGRVLWDAKTYKYQKKNRQHNRKVEITIKYNTDAYISIWSYGDTAVARTASLLKADDEIVVFGRMIKKWRFKDGEKITSVYIDPYIIISSRLLEVANILANSDKFNAMLQDEFESLDDFNEVEQEQAEDVSEDGNNDFGFA